MSLELIIAVSLFTFVAAVTPGPNNIMIMASGMNYGVRASMPHYCGICFGFPVMLASVGLGLQTIFLRLPILHDIIKFLGIVYLVYLAWKIAQFKPANDTKNGNTQAQPLTFMASVLFQWVNPKAWFMATGGISTFTIISDSFTSQVLTIVLISFVISFPTAGFWLFAGRMSQRLLTEPGHQQLFNRVMAALLLLSVAPVIVNEILHRFASNVL